jgi:hypothetical protein
MGATRKEVVMNPRICRLAWLVLLAGGAGCASTGTLDVKPEALGAFECVDRGAIASPPPRSVLALGRARGEEKTIVQREWRPLLTLRPCADGKVPASKTPAKPTVAKGNPLIGSIDRPVSDFFKEGGTGEIVRKNLRPFQKVYYIPPGPDEKRHEAPPDPPDCNGIFYYGFCYYYGPASYASTADGGGMTVTVKRPAIHGAGHSLDEISVQGGKDNGNIIELGWNVSTSQYPDADPHLFVYHWINWAGTCYDTCGWHQYSPTYFPGMNLAALVGHDVYNGYVHFEGNWWAWFDNQWLGYFSDSEWSGSYTKSSMIQWFGEVATNNGTPPDVQMGNGLFPTEIGAARMATLCDVDAAAWVCWYRDLQSLGPNYPPYYDIRRTGFGETRYGGPGH